MSANPKRKMCWNCEGNIELDQEICPYCRTSFEESSDESFSNSALYPDSFKKEKIISAAPFNSQHDDYEEDEDEPEEDFVEDTSLSVLYTMTLLMSGSLFMLFGLVLFLFSTNGQLILSWNSSYWYLYLLLAAPMLFLSIRSLAYSSEE